MPLVYSHWLFLLAVVQCSHGLDSLRFFAIGDMGGLPIEPYYTYTERSTAKELGHLAGIYKPSMIFELGDNFYFDGVTSVTDKRWKHTFEDVFSAPSLQVPWYIIAGNHDHRGNVTAQIDYSSRSKRWNFPNLYYYREFRIDKKTSFGIVFIDTVELCGNTHDDEHAQPSGPLDRYQADKQWMFIQQILSQSKANYLFVAGHYPIYSIAEHGPTECLVSSLLPLMDKYKVNAYLSGHDHNLQHLRTKSSSGQNIDFFVSGMANFIDESTDHKQSVPDNSLQFHYAYLLSKGGLLYAEATPDNMTMTYLNSLGDQLYSTHIFPRDV